jgi:hypothetical protein
VVPRAHGVHEGGVALALTGLLGPRASNNPEGSFDRRGHGRRVP